VGIGRSSRTAIYRYLAGVAWRDLPAVLDPAGARDLMDILWSDDGSADTAQQWPRGDTLVDIYSRSVNRARPARETIAASFPWCEPHAAGIVDLFRAYAAQARVWPTRLRRPAAGVAHHAHRLDTVRS
jgi:hypothetical protein